ncbi:hypothetical protein BCE75_10231 [Isoptericola sp. CG 20/1183]|uniref:BON domain-containing protein n=1 Tax=Isoptericola halotolerans TaxID=300560 RepID=A0ABX5EKD3_9MICO|nr:MULTISPECIES: hypothetical protein [Isoptericola]MCK0118191.1 hypothetical protein [Isoptericola sp. S6320L]PRZ09324.1 hypothetical protein BCE75_10231 [Isoptericola sp. CG 20/1183]PRZ10125.1 hypothetical protein BCL65_101263 [Isoptericola halotolerans]
MVTRDEARTAKSTLRERLGRVEGVCGVGLAQRGDTHDWVLQVNVQNVSARKDVPPDVDGVPVRVHVVGAVEAL